jgi:hypothetical protein
MSLFGKKIELDPPRSIPEPHNQNGAETPATSGSSPAGRPYGIAEVIQLMHSLPLEQNAELVVRVIRSTLESLNVRVGDIIQDGATKETKLQQRIETLKAEITDLERQIDARGQEIGRLQSELSDTTTAKERLLMTQSSSPAELLSADVAAALEPLLTPSALSAPSGPPPIPRRDPVPPPAAPPPVKAAPAAAEERK